MFDIVMLNIFEREKINLKFVNQNETDLLYKYVCQQVVRLNYDCDDKNDSHDCDKMTMINCLNSRKRELK